MRYLVLTSSNPNNKAGVAALDLYKSLKSTNNDVLLLVKEYTSINDLNIVSMESSGDRFLRLIKRKFANLKKMLFVFRGDIVTDSKYSVLNYDHTINFYKTENIINKMDGFNPDVIIICFMQNFISFKNIYELHKLTKAKINLYLMDMGPMTGGCHYAWSCENYINDCGKCPAMFSDVVNDQSNKNLEFKKQFISNIDIKVVTASNWTLNQVKKSSLFRNKFSANIYLSVDNSIFRPSNHDSLRKRIDIEFDVKIIFFGATTVFNQRKGFKHLVDALEDLKFNYKELKIHLLIAGFLEERIAYDFPFSYTQLGHLDFDSLAEAFRTADVFLNPSIEDSGPMMINQSIACGTPVVSYNMGVAADLVITGQTGYLAKLYKHENLSRGVFEVLSLDDSKMKEMRLNCVELSKRFLSYECQSKAFMSLNS